MRDEPIISVVHFHAEPALVPLCCLRLPHLQPLSNDRNLLMSSLSLILTLRTPRFGPTRASAAVLLAASPEARGPLPGVVLSAI